MSGVEAVQGNLVSHVATAHSVAIGSPSRPSNRGFTRSAMSRSSADTPAEVPLRGIHRLTRHHQRCGSRHGTLHQTVSSGAPLCSQSRALRVRHRIQRQSRSLAVPRIAYVSRICSTPTKSATHLDRCSLSVRFLHKCSLRFRLDSCPPKILSVIVKESERTQLRYPARSTRLQVVTATTSPQPPLERRFEHVQE